MDGYIGKCDMANATTARCNIKNCSCPRHGGREALKTYHQLMRTTSVIMPKIFDHPCLYMIFTLTGTLEVS